MERQKAIARLRGLRPALDTVPGRFRSDEAWNKYVEEIGMAVAGCLSGERGEEVAQAIRERKERNVESDGTNDRNASEAGSKRGKGSKKDKKGDDTDDLLTVINKSRRKD